MGIQIDRRHGGSHQTCSILQADNCWVMSHSKMHLEQMMKALKDAERWDHEPTNQQVCDGQALVRTI